MGYFMPSSVQSGVWRGGGGDIVKNKEICQLREQASTRARKKAERNDMHKYEDIRRVILLDK